MTQPEYVNPNEEKIETASNYPPQSFHPTIKRKPLATATATTTTTRTRTETPTNTPPTLPPTYTNTHQPQNPNLLSRLTSKFKSLPLKRRLLLFFLPLALLVLIVTLAATLSRRSHSNLPLPTSHGGPFTGDLTYYAPGLGACGLTSSSRDSIVSISHYVFDAASTSSNPNMNPLCGKKIRVRRGGRSRDVTVVDRCTGCEPTDLDVTVSVFGDLADVDLGRVTVEWAWLEDVTVSVTASASPSTGGS